MNENQAITYSLLAQIRNSGTFIKGPLDIFVPLLKRALYQLSEENLFKSNTIIPIQKKAEELYNIDFPIPVIKKILTQIEIELNTSESKQFQLFKDGSYILQKFVFEDFEEKLQSSKKEVNKLEELFEEFCKINKLSNNNEKNSLFDFIDKNRHTLAKYFNAKDQSNGVDYTIEAKFVDYFKRSSQVYDIIRKIYLGSILTCYIQFKTEALKLNVELVFDTNFIVSLLDLNTEESTHTCNKLLEICKNLGYNFTVLKDTIEETQKLIRTKAEYFDKTFLQKRINHEDIYNACERRKLNKSDLERIVDNIEDLIGEKGINEIYDTSKYRNLARHSKEFEFLKSIRNSEVAALHDATAIYYIREKRSRRIKDFEGVNCWFVNNSISHDTTVTKETTSDFKGYQSELIKADELLNILWLSSPQVTSKITDKDLTDIGLSSIVAFTLNEGLPKAQIIRELDENITKYAKENLSSKDIINISTRIVNKQLKNLQELNEVANTNSEEFVKRLQDEASKQEDIERNRIEKFQRLFDNIENHQSALEQKNKEADELLEINKNLTSELQEKVLQSSKELKDFEESERLKKNERIERYKDEKVKFWRRKSWFELYISIILIILFGYFVFYESNFDLNNTMNYLKKLEKNIIIAILLAVSTMVFTCFIVNGLFQKYRNHSNIEAYKRSIKIPDNI